MVVSVVPFPDRGERWRRRLEARLARVERAIAWAEAWEADRRLPPPLRPSHLSVPTFSSAGLAPVRRALQTKLALLVNRSN